MAFTLTNSPFSTEPNKALRDPPTQAGDFVIQVLDGPLASRVLIQGSPAGQVKLSGRSLPYRGLTFEGTQRVKTTWLPGNPVATQQVMGPTEEPTTINGMWKDRFLGNGAAQDLCDLFDDIRRSGSLIEVRWGLTNFSQGRVRRGVIKRTKFSFERPQDVAWEVTFEWRGTDERTAPPNFVVATVNPREGINEVANGFQTAKDAIQAWVTDPLAMVTGKKFELQAKLGEFEDVATAAIDGIYGIAQTITTVANAPRDTIGRLVNLAELGGDALATLKEAILSSNDALDFSLDDPLTTQRMQRQQFDTIEAADIAQENAITTAASLRGMLAPEVIAEVRPPPGSDLRDLALTFYGDPDLWGVIAAFNNLGTSAVPAIPTGPSDNPARPILIPRAPSGVLAGDMC